MVNLESKKKQDTWNFKSETEAGEANMKKKNSLKGFKVETQNTLNDSHKDKYNIDKEIENLKMEFDDKEKPPLNKQVSSENMKK